MILNALWSAIEWFFNAIIMVFVAAGILIVGLTFGYGITQLVRQVIHSVF